MPDQKSPKKSVKKVAKRPARAEPAPKVELPVKAFASAAAFERWLKTHHAKAPGLWLRYFKKATGKKTLSYAEAVEVALCWGWIDGQAAPFDADSWLQRFVPRRPRSMWSKINRTRVAALIEAGRMQPAGLAHIASAKKDGRWQAAYDSPSTAKPPPDFAAALKQSPQAAAFFATLNATNRYAVLFRVQAPKKPETRARKIRELIAMLERNERIHG